MIYIEFHLRNPWWKRSGKVFYKHGKTPFRHKFWEFEVERIEAILELRLRVDHRTSHAGASVTFGLFGYTATFTLYDSRHWDYENDVWYQGS